MNIEKARKRFLPMTETMFYILLSLQEERHGYGVMLHVKEVTKGRIELGAGTIYQSLGKLESEGLIKATKDVDRKKYYLSTEVGTKILKEEARRIKEIYASLGDIL